MVRYSCCSSDSSGDMVLACSRLIDTLTLCRTPFGTICPSINALGFVSIIGYPNGRYAVLSLFDGSR